MDVLVVVDNAAVPERIAVKARRRVDVAPGDLSSSTVADLRAHIPRAIGGIGHDSDEGLSDAAGTAGQLHRAGLPVILYTDRPVNLEPGIEVDWVHDPGPRIEAVDSL